MKLMRNREVQRLLLLCLLGTALIAAAGFCAGIVPGVLALAGGLVLSGGVMGVTLRRYCAIAQLNQDIDRVLHGGVAADRLKRRGRTRHPAQRGRQDDHPPARGGGQPAARSGCIWPTRWPTSPTSCERR